PVSREFVVSQGTVRYFGTPDQDAALDIEAKHVVHPVPTPGAPNEDITVVAHITGTLIVPKVTLAAEKQDLSQTELISLLLFGKRSVDLAGDQGGIADQRAVLQSAFSVLSGEIEQTIVSGGVPVDYVEIQPGGGGQGTPLSSLQLAVGRQLGPKTFLVVNAGYCQGGQGGVQNLLGLSLPFRLSPERRTEASFAPEQGFDALVCYGGDGTAMEIAAGAADGGIPLGLVPGGTGNLLAGNLRLPRGAAAAARVILAGRTAAIDLGTVERPDGTHYFAVCSGTGFDARLMARTGAAEKRRWKMAAYVMHAFATLPDVTSPLHRVTVDGVAHELPAAMVLVANCGELVPPFLRLRDNVAPDDGWLDVLVLRAEGALESLSAFYELLRRPRNGARRLWF